MVTRYLPDTNVWIHYLKDPTGELARSIAKRSAEQIVTCSVVRAELLHGAEKYGNRDRRRRLVETTLAPYVSFPFDDESASRYASIRRDLEQRGAIIGPYDLQIAAIGLAQGATVVTDNVAEFSRVPGLRVENWMPTRKTS